MIYENIRNLREDHDKNAKRISWLSEYKANHIFQNTSLGKSIFLLKYLLKLADFYNVSVDYLLGRTKNK